MKSLRVAVLLLGPTIAFGQASTGADGEPIIFLPHGGIAHDGPVKAVTGYTPSPADTPADPSWFPRPLLFGGPSLVGNGYQTFAGSVGGALLLNSSKLLGDFEAQYMNAKKTNDNTLNNRKGTKDSWWEGSFIHGVKDCISAVERKGVKPRQQTIQRSNGDLRWV